MKRSPSDAHPEEMILLAYLDAELPRAMMRSTKEHLQACWKCRASIAELELQIHEVSKLLSCQGESDTTRIKVARDKFLERKLRWEARSRLCLVRFTLGFHIDVVEACAAGYLGAT